MPVEVSLRTSLGFKDLSMSFEKNPLTKDLVVLKNENAIKQSIKNLVLTEPGERFFNPELGSGINQSLFDLIDPVSASQIQSQIENTIENFEPRVSLTDVFVQPNYDDGLFVVTITYDIIGIDVPQQSLSFPLVKTR